MKNLILISLIIFLLSLAACGKPEEEQEPPANQEALVNCAETLVAHQYLLIKYEELEVENERLIAREGEYLTVVRTLEDANLALGIELGIVKGLEEGRAGNYEALLNELAALRAEKKEWGILAAKEYEQLLKNYNALVALYPPTHFPNDKELIKWRANTGNVTELGCLGLQRLALADGYIVSAHPDFDYCVAIASDYWYKLIPEDKYLVEKIRRVNYGR